MNRLIPILLSVLIVLVLATGILVWRADQRARDDAERQACIQRTEANAMIGLLVPTILTGGEGLDKDNQLRSLGALGNQLDDC